MCFSKINSVLFSTFKNAYKRISAITRKFENFIQIEMIKISFIPIQSAVVFGTRISFKVANL